MAIFLSFGWPFSARGDTYIVDLLQKHFGTTNPTELSIVKRDFPFRVRADLQRAIDSIIDSSGPVRVMGFCGVPQQHALQGIDFASLLIRAHRMLRTPAATPEYEELDIGEDQPARCVKSGLWLLERDGHRFAVLLAAGVDMLTQTRSLSIQFATRPDDAGTQLRDQFFRQMERAVNESRSYRGKILSLEQERAYDGKSSGIRVHRLNTVERSQVILPAKTLELLDRNVIQFASVRETLRTRGQSTRKGLLFYGPPGTGKSHTIHYLAKALRGHTMLLITAEQVGLLSEYMALARLLQPSVVVIEDADLIARDRTQMNSACEEALLNKLLNEMDGLRESADILFILTTNRPEMLEAAPASRPGRVDQAIEFPLPDDNSREKLVRLYSAGAPLSEELVRMIVARTDKVSAAFIKELMRRAIQFNLERSAGDPLHAEDVNNALEEMLFTGGSLNIRLLGGAAQNGGTGSPAPM
jgi:DNA replication protein DnaC